MNKFETFKSNISNHYHGNIIINISPSSAFRARCEFAFNNDSYVMYNKGNKIYLNIFNFASTAIQKTMARLLKLINQSKTIKKKLFQINFRSNSQGKVLVTLVYHQKIDEMLQNRIDNIASKLNINIIVRAKNQIYATNNFFLEDFITSKKIKIFQTDNCFYQPNRFLLPKMINKVISFINNPKDLIELYCGVGTFTLPLSDYFNKVFSTENNRKSVECLDMAIKENNIDNIYYARLSSEEVSELIDGKKYNRMKDIKLSNFNFSHILVDPPRSGLSKNVIKIINKFDNIIYISCSPESYVRDIKYLKDYKITNLELFDQFPNSKHLEIVSLLSKK